MSRRETVLVTGGAGFIGTNLCDRLARDGARVVVLDDLSRPGVEENLFWLIEEHGDAIRPVVRDVCDERSLGRLVPEVDRVFHLAAQVAVTTSLRHPLPDFRTNAEGTLKLLEALRTRPDPPPFVFTSTNKVYGCLEDLALRRTELRYEPEDAVSRARGIGEDRPLNLRSPYGCSKGAADQYTLDYARTFGLPAVVFRMSCIYGPHQRGTEDQGWVAHFLLRALEDEPITIFGDGRQVRDILYVDDLVKALLSVSRRAAELSGRVFNVGGGSANSVSLLEVLRLVEELRGRPPEVRFEGWRPGDQRYYVTDTRRLREAVEWEPSVSVRDGVGRLYRWLLESGSARRRPAAAAGAS